jgi:hypothetical protein
MTVAANTPIELIDQVYGRLAERTPSGGSDWGGRSRSPRRSS